MTGTAITNQDINHLWWTAYQAGDSATAITATEALGHGPCQQIRRSAPNCRALAST